MYRQFLQGVIHDRSKTEHYWKTNVGHMSTLQHHCRPFGGVGMYVGTCQKTKVYHKDWEAEYFQKDKERKTCGS